MCIAWYNIALTVLGITDHVIITQPFLGLLRPMSLIYKYFLIYVLPFMSLETNVQNLYFDYIRFLNYVKLKRVITIKNFD